MNMQAYIDGLGAQWQKERAATQMTLGKMIAALESMPEGAEVDALGGEHSYRGYYSDLAFNRGEGRMPAATLLTICKNAMGQVYIGYKGGDYVMGALTPLWVAEYGCCGEKIMGIRADGTIVTAEDD